MFGNRTPEGQLIEAIVTGVGRPGRDDGLVFPTAPVEHTFKPPPPRSEPEPVPEPPREFVEVVKRGAVTVQVKLPTDWDTLGQVEQGSYTLFSNGVIEVESEQGHPLGSGQVEAGGDAASVARSILRRKRTH